MVVVALGVVMVAEALGVAMVAEAVCVARVVEAVGSVCFGHERLDGGVVSDTSIDVVGVTADDATIDVIDGDDTSIDGVGVTGEDTIDGAVVIDGVITSESNGNRNSPQALKA